jgi:hypothetical protein
MTNPNLDTELRTLPCHDVDPRVSERVSRLALAILRDERENLGRPWRARIERTWRSLEPALSAGVVGTYLVWMVWTLVAFIK